MMCLRCGECCRKYSPLSVDPENEPCKHLVMVSYRESVEELAQVAVCGVYDHRPVQCQDHRHAESKICPIGLSVLNIVDANRLAAREHIISLVDGNGGVV